MKHTRITALATISLAATLSLTACSGDGSGKDSAASSSAASSSSSSSDGGSKSGGNANSSNSNSGSSTANNAEPDSANQDTQAGAGNTNSAAKSSDKVTFCKTEDLAIDATNAAPDQTSGRINIAMINRGSTTCSATGFAGVDIKDADHTSNPIERGPAQPRVTILKPGDAAIFDLAYTIDTTGNSLASPTNILVTPPNETHTISLEWPTAAGQIKGAYTDVQVYPTHTTK
ncbi:DUF4232 domain-containing protein [Streptomyces sp. NPDC091387]|uniref:DUF4232 domain-containing protein n=1 Tax=Streptomyces sp. NPDC091387 TaxID=3365998 RepID=UPI003819DBB4